MKRTHLIVFIALFSVMLIGPRECTGNFFSLTLKPPHQKQSQMPASTTLLIGYRKTKEPFGQKRQSSPVVKGHCIKLKKDVASLAIHHCPVLITSPTASSKPFFHGKTMTALASSSAALVMIEAT